MQIGSIFEGDTKSSTPKLYNNCYKKLLFIGQGAYGKISLV
jgi:hypothetical protein